MCILILHRVVLDRRGAVAVVMEDIIEMEINIRMWCSEDCT
jgi:hypothetical protein